MIIYPIILSSFSITATSTSTSATSNQIRPKLCIDCKFYKKDFFTSSEFGKCSFFPIEKKNCDFLVTGNNDNNNKKYDKGVDAKRSSLNYGRVISFTISHKF